MVKGDISCTGQRLIARGDMDGFGTALRALRVAEGQTQQRLAREIGFGRSTLANIEAGREIPSQRFWDALCACRPAWRDRLTPLLTGSQHDATSGPSTPLENRAFKPPEEWVLGGPFVVERLTFAYIFEHSRSPSEILEVRRVRATRNGADSYGLKLVNTKGTQFESSEEPLWGGDVEHHAVQSSGYLRRFRFDRVLRRGQTHEFATRHWVERDPDPGTAVMFSMSIPAVAVGIHLHFNGPERPMRTLRFGPLADDRDVPDGAPLEGGVPLRPTGSASAYFRAPEPGATYGLAWEW
jgi:transcriptional regulator with XRE-family HTH domain